MGKGKKQMWEREKRRRINMREDWGWGDVEFYMKRDSDVAGFGETIQISLSFSF